MSPERDLSRARLSSTLTFFPTLSSKSGLPTSRMRKKLGEGPSICQLSIAPPAPFTSTVKYVWGLRQSIAVSLPVTVTRSLKSNTAVMLWCADAGSTSSTANTRSNNVALEVMRCLLGRNRASIPRLRNKGNRSPRPAHAEPKRKREAGHNHIHPSRTHAGIRPGQSAHYKEMKQECQAKQHHLDAKRMAVDILSGGRQKDQQSRGHHENERARGPGPQLPRQPGDPIVSS